MLLKPLAFCTSPEVHFLTARKLLMKCCLTFSRNQMYTHTRAHARTTHKDIHTHTDTHTHTQIHTHTRTHTTHTHTQTHSHTHTLTRTHILSHTHIYVHMFISNERVMWSSELFYFRNQLRVLNKLGTEYSASNIAGEVLLWSENR
jgi:hypothetical protein